MDSPTPPSQAAPSPDAVQLAFERLARDRSRRLDFTRFVPLLAIVLLAALSAGLAYLLIAEDTALRRDALHRDTDTLAQSMNLRLQAISETTIALARDAASPDATNSRLLAAAREAMAVKPEVVHIASVDDAARVTWSAASPGPLGEAVRSPNTRLTSERLVAALNNARDAHSSFFSPPYEDTSGSAGPDNGGPFTDLVAPIYSEDSYRGAVVARISLPELLRRTVTPDVAQRYRVSLFNDAGVALASTTASETPVDAMVYGVPIYLLPDGVSLQASKFLERSPLLGNVLAWIVAGLTLAVMATLIALMRRDAKQASVERTLRAETAFRRAMEDSLATGLAVFDRNGVMRHVNAAFCQMTGWNESELVGVSAPFPYWPADQFAAHRATMQAMLSGKAPAAGSELKVRRRDDSVFDGRLYVSPLLSDDGEQLGWMAALVDVTEPKRISEQLATAHERFTKVLESLDDAVSVVAPTTDGGGDELLFANRSYRDLYGADAVGHRKLQAGLTAHGGVMAGEVYDGEQRRWFDVRMRDVRWVDGRDVRLQIATDVTERKATEEIVRQQQEKVQLTSRLMTMGEMASSLAHELNQPLTAISNYSLGTVSRLRDGNVSTAELLPALEKTAGQAQRAGNIIRRIREFVKRAEPRRRPTAVARIVEDAIGFAEIEAAKKAIAIETHVATGLPPLDVDPILVEQLLLNLLKNAIDAMDQATVRRIDLVVRRADDMAEFSVIDHGSGIPPELRAHLFQPFFSTKSEGMGMGLNICRSIVEFHQGRLQLEENPEGGTIFRFTLPLANAAGVDENARLAEGKQK
ncbi:MAG TPA: PAS domain S-box protein [Burkholderiaceae bacterium]|nr:PAS domain S-box protein [Burkholderiaceae bacterium]HQR75593.1 PAS domain S-box protein [Burkholderiaceae bacterium]